MHPIKNFFSSHVRLVCLAIVIIVALGSAWYISANQAPVLATYTVSSGNISSSLDEPATVMADNKSGLSFQEAGQIAGVYVKEGDTVATGQKLAELDSASLKAGLEQAKAALSTAESGYQELLNGNTPDQINVLQTALQNASTTLATTIAQQNTAVANAYTTLINTSFSAVPGTGNTDNVTVTVSGTYTGSQQGSYNLSVVPTGGGLMFEATGLETGNGQVKTQPMPLGSNGLYIQFSGTPSAADTWTIAVPNAYATGYTANYNAYQAALKTQSAMVSAAQSALNQAQANLQLAQSPPRPEDIAKQKAAAAQAQAAVAVAQVALDNSLLTAPFSGTVQNLTAQVGQVVSPNSQVMSLVNNGGLKIQAYVAETDIAKLKVSDMASVTLDAFGTGTTFPATITAVDSTETQVNGTPSYLVILHFTNDTSQINDGMTGRVSIQLDQQSNAIEVPSNLVINDGDQYFVLLKTASGVERKKVETGLVGDNGMTEITSGLSSGDTLINF